MTLHAQLPSMTVPHSKGLCLIILDLRSETMGEAEDNVWRRRARSFPSWYIGVKETKKSNGFWWWNSHRESTAHIALSIRIDKTDNLADLFIGHGLVARQRQLSRVDILRDGICTVVPFAVGPLLVGRNRIMNHCADTITAKILLKAITETEL